MKDQLISFETAKLAKEKGFEVVTEFSYDGQGTSMHSQWNKYSCHESFSPKCTQSLLQKWLREKYGVITEAEYWDEVLGYESRVTLIKTNCVEYSQTKNKTYEEALEVGLFESLKLVPLNEQQIPI